MRLRWMGVLMMVLLAVGSLPAAAGTAEDPEISDRCGDFGTEEHRRAMPGWADICAGWVETLSAEGEVPELRITLRMAEDLGGRLPASYGMWWQAGGCGYTAWHSDAQAHLPAESWVNVSCDPDEEPECTVDDPQLNCEPAGRRVGAPEVDFQISGTDASWTIRFDGALAEHAGAYEHGSIVDVGGAVAGARAREYVVASYGCSFGTSEPTRCRSIGGDLIFGARSYTVGT